LNNILLLSKMNKQIQVVSDVHLEFYGEANLLDFVTPSAPFLAILGDLGYPKKPIYHEFIAQASAAFEKVFIVSGNHEYYNRDYADSVTMDEIDEVIDGIIKLYDNVFYLNNRVYQLSPEVIIAGTTLWHKVADFNKVEIRKQMNDYKYIYIGKKQKLTTDYVNERFNKNVEWLTEIFNSNKNSTIIVMTHHLPSFDLISPRYHQYMELNCAFASNLDKLMIEYPNIKYWLCGHTHEPVTKQINNTTCVINPVGYRGENDIIDKARLIDI